MNNANFHFMDTQVHAQDFGYIMTNYSMRLTDQYYLIKGGVRVDHLPHNDFYQNLDITKQG